MLFVSDSYRKVYEIDLHCMVGKGIDPCLRNSSSSKRHINPEVETPSGACEFHAAYVGQRTQQA